jgi:hypothetical protein
MFGVSGFKFRSLFVFGFRLLIVFYLDFIDFCLDFADFVFGFHGFLFGFPISPYFNLI